MKDRGYVEVGDLRMYYEVHGDGEPLVLLHGGFTNIDLSFGSLLPGLAEDRLVIALEQQGHGHTPDRDQPLTYTQMADDTAAALITLGIGGADIFGYSDGGNVAIGLALRRPDLVRKLALAGVNYNRDGIDREFIDFLDNIDPDNLVRLNDSYVGVAPEPERWPILVDKVARLSLDFDGWRPEELQSIEAPTFVVVGDRDVVPLGHTGELVEMLPDSRLAVLPNTDHISLLGRTEWLLSMLGEFFDSSDRNEK